MTTSPQHSDEWLEELLETLYINAQFNKPDKEGNFNKSVMSRDLAAAKQAILTELKKQEVAAEHTGALAYRDKMSTAGRPLGATPLIEKMPVPCPGCDAEEYADWFLYPHQVYNAVFPGGVGHYCLPCFCEVLLSDP